MPDALHHLHKRKRAHQKKETYPHPNKLKFFWDHLIYVVGILNPLAGSTQAYKIWAEQTADGVSIVMFAFNIFSNVCWFVYGFLHKEKPIMLMYILWFIINVIIVTGIVAFT